MNREDIIRMAREANLPSCHTTHPKALERFAVLVAAHERQWVGLTDEEIDHAAEQSDNYASFTAGALFAQYRLEEKNT